VKRAHIHFPGNFFQPGLFPEVCSNIFNSLGYIVESMLVLTFHCVLFCCTNLIILVSAGNPKIAFIYASSGFTDAKVVHLGET
jgi:hypothetical protein